MRECTSYTLILSWIFQALVVVSQSDFALEDLAGSHEHHAQLRPPSGHKLLGGLR